MAREVEYLGHQISLQGIFPPLSKVEAIANSPMPQNISELRAFLGMFTYFGNFQPQLSTTIEPLHLLLSKGVVWKWEAAQTKAFKAAKTMLPVVGPWTAWSITTHPRNLFSVVIALHMA